MYNYAQPCILLLEKNNRAKKTAGFIIVAFNVTNASFFFRIMTGYDGFIYPFA